MCSSDLLKLRQDPVQQARLVDVYIGRVGSVVVGRATGARPSGLKLHVVRGKVRGIVVGSRRYRTARGIMVGSRLLDVLAAYPRDPSTASAKAIRAGTYKVGRATFKFRRGRVSGIAFGR